MLKLKVDIDGKDIRFFEGDRIIAIDTEHKLIVKKFNNHVEGVVAVFNHWRYYEFMDDDKKSIDPLRVMWIILREAMDKKLDYKLKESIIGSKIIGMDIQGTRIVLRTDAKPVRYGNAIYDTSRIIVKS